MRCIPNIQIFLAPLETIIQIRFLQANHHLVMLNVNCLLSRLVWVVLVLLILHSILLFSFLRQLQLLLLWFCSGLLLPLLMFCLINWRLSDMLLMNIVSLSLTFMTLCCHLSPHLCTDLFCCLVNLALLAG